MARTTRSRRPPAATLARRWGAIAVVVIVAYLYYHPLRTYLSTRAELGAQRSEVAELSAEKRALQARLTASMSIDALAGQARELGYVRPGEHLYIVKGIEAWLNREATIARHG